MSMADKVRMNAHISCAFVWHKIVVCAFILLCAHSLILGMRIFLVHFSYINAGMRIFSVHFPGIKMFMCIFDECLMRIGCAPMRAFVRIRARILPSKVRAYFCAKCALQLIFLYVCLWQIILLGAHSSIRVQWCVRWSYRQLSYKLAYAHTFWRARIQSGWMRIRLADRQAMCALVVLTAQLSHEEL